MPDSVTRWNVSVSKEADIAARWPALEHTAAEAQSKLADMTPEALEALIDEAVEWARRG